MRTARNKASRPHSRRKTKSAAPDAIPPLETKPRLRRTGGLEKLGKLDSPVLYCGVLDEWEDEDSPVRSSVETAVYDGLGLKYARFEPDQPMQFQAGANEPGPFVAVCLRPEPAVQSLKFIAIPDIRSQDKRTARIGLDCVVQLQPQGLQRGGQEYFLMTDLICRKENQQFHCSLSSEFFNIDLYYDRTTNKITRLRYSSLRSLSDLDKGKRAPKRSRDELPDPALSPHAEVNRMDAKFQTRITPETSDQVEAFLRASGMKKTSLTEQALREFIQRHAEEFGFDPDAPEPESR
jgi:hypothetical protein